jgi:hypothetical protein
VGDLDGSLVDGKSGVFKDFNGGLVDVDGGWRDFDGDLVGESRGVKYCLSGAGELVRGVNEMQGSLIVSMSSCGRD